MEEETGGFLRVTVVIAETLRDSQNVRCTVAFDQYRRIDALGEMGLMNAVRSCDDTVSLWGEWND